MKLLLACYGAILLFQSQISHAQARQREGFPNFTETRDGKIAVGLNLTVPTAITAFRYAGDTVYVTKKTCPRCMGNNIIPLEENTKILILGTRLFGVRKVEHRFQITDLAGKRISRNENWK